MSFYSIVVDCDSPPTLTNGQVDSSSGTTFGSIVDYICNPGYTLTGSSSLTCGSDGNWSPNEPGTCECKLFDNFDLSPL